MSTLSEFRTSANSVIGILNGSITAYGAYNDALNAIDPASPSAQSDFDAIVADRAAYKTSIDSTLAAADASSKEIQANLGPEDTNAGALIRDEINAKKTEQATASASFSGLKDSTQRVITDSAPIPRANVVTPNVATPRKVDNALFAAAPASNELNKFISMVKNSGVILSSKYSVILPPIASFNMTDIALQCNVAGMPDITVNGGDSRIYGESAEIPNGVVYGQLPLSFIVTNDFDTLGYFEAWSNLVYDRLNRSVGYYKDFAFPITVQVLDRAGNARYTVFFMDCWPKNINTTSLSGDSHGLMTVNVSMQYKYWISSITGKLNPNTNPPWDGRPSSLQTPGNGPLSSVMSSGMAANFASNVGIYGNNGLAASMMMGPQIGSSLLSASNESSLAVKGLFDMADGTSVGGLMSKYASQLGTGSSMMGAGIGGFASNLTTILAPAGQIAAGVAGMSGALRSMDNLLGRLGIRTNIGNTVTSLNGVAGQIAVLGQLNGIPGAMSSLGSSVGSISGDIAQIQRSLVNVPGATKAMSNSFGNLSNVFTQSGNDISALGNLQYGN